MIYASKQNAVLAKALKESGTKVLPTPTAIVDGAALAVTIVDLLNGFGSPNSGSAVSTATDKLNLFIKDLDPSCIPDARDWSGTAATAYTAQVNLLKGYAEQMKNLDKVLKGHLGDQAAAIKQAHLTCTVNVAVLTAAAGIALALYLIPVVGPEVSCAWQIVAAFACCAAVFVVEMLTLANSMSLSNQVATLGLQYVQLGRDVDDKLAGEFGTIRGKVASEASSKLSDFKDISSGLSSFEAVPTVSSLAAKAGTSASPTQRLLLDAAGEAPPQSAPAPAVTPDGTTPAAPAAPAAATAPAAAAAPAFTLPTMSQVGSAASRAAKATGGLSQETNQLSQAVGSAQSFAQMGQHGQGAAAPAGDAKGAEAAPEEAAFAADGHGAAAASGTEGAGRAPVDAEVRDEPAPTGRERAR